MTRLLAGLAIVIVMTGCEEFEFQQSRKEAHRAYHAKVGFDFTKECKGCSTEAMQRLADNSGCHHTQTVRTNHARF